MEYDIYSRYNFKITSFIGKSVCEQMDFDHKQILELGGNSGGLGTEIMRKYQGCTYTIVDHPIPCQIGNEFKALNQVKIDYVSSNIFDLELKKEKFDYVILMNLLHDFNDDQCDQVIMNSLRSCEKHPKFIIIEDILEDEYTPKDAIMHGLRLSVACYGGKQRTIEDFKNLFCNYNYKVEQTISLDKIHRMMIIQPAV
ncbi:MAG: methyltransferase domain-containing protein [Clostridia bacterium]|nr:methyltransferase domain-containing protein [Clostridia bacterium]